ncbi:Protein of unknown function (DUF789) [Quillaja saponaria]|uniref:Uncharacterized protein n=1 Tax=Quillaja saponaria TaxID=32244 RepID=A0AAD7QF08_QUISA|nr:Protein of unknown function (DUF789) [Quillaja saponaria]
MSGSGGVAIAGSRNRNRSLGENRFYNPPPMRKRQQKQEQEMLHQQQEQQHRRPPLSKSSSSVTSEKRPESSSSAPSDCSVSSRGATETSNLDRFLNYTTPIVPAQYFPKTSLRRWRTSEAELHPYFVLGDLWEFFREWSAYGAGVPLLLNGSDSVVQYYVPSLSGIQLYMDPSKPFLRLRNPGEESDAESARETSSDSSSGYGHERGIYTHENGSWPNITDASINGIERVPARNKTFIGSSSDESESCNPPGQLIFEYFERAVPYKREPLANKISDLTSQFPKLRTCRSCDLSPSSWMSVAWYPIYRIPTGPTLQNLEACFLTFHSLSTPFQSTSADEQHFQSSRGRDLSSKLLLPTFGLASYKFKVSVWTSDGVYGCQKLNSLLRAADNWLRLLQVEHPDYNFFLSHNSY